MGALIKRELRALNIASDNKNPTLIYGILGIGIPVVIWLLGPGLIGFYDAEGLKISMSVVGMVMVMQTVSNSLEQEKASRQMTFLNTLPVKKSQIVSAKFISVLLLSSMAIIWINIVMLLTVFITGISMEEYGLLLGFFSSLILFIAAIILSTYFFNGSQNTFMMILLAIVIWGVVFGLSGFFLKSMGMEPDIRVFTVYMGLSLVVYLICWLLSVRRVTKKGFPLNEGHKTGRVALKGGAK